MGEVSARGAGTAPRVRRNHDTRNVTHIVNQKATSSAPGMTASEPARIHSANGLSTSPDWRENQRMTAAGSVSNAKPTHTSVQNRGPSASGRILAEAANTIAAIRRKHWMAFTATRCSDIGGPGALSGALILPAYFDRMFTAAGGSGFRKYIPPSTSSVSASNVRDPARNS